MIESTTGRTATLLLRCPDRQGIAAGVAEWIASNGGNIVHAEQHFDRAADVFFQRVEFVPSAEFERIEDIQSSLEPVATRFSMSVDVRFSDQPQRIAILCSKQGHCVHDLVSRWKLGEMPGELAMVISNHETHRATTEAMGVPFHHLPVTADSRAEQETAMLRLLADANIDLMIMARYMQILSDRVITDYPERVINIHHSFLPAFPGGKPYHQAYDRGVKLIGATAHYATVDLDEGPIIEQDVQRVNHRHDPDDLVAHGRDLERVVLARAVKAHLDHRVMVYDNKTVVFE